MVDRLTAQRVHRRNPLLLIEEGQLLIQGPLGHPIVGELDRLGQPPWHPAGIVPHLIIRRRLNRKWFDRSQLDALTCGQDKIREETRLLSRAEFLNRQLTAASHGIPTLVMAKGRKLAKIPHG